MMKKNIVWLVFVVIALASMIVLTGCNKSDTPTNTSKVNVTKTTNVSHKPVVNATARLNITRNITVPPNTRINTTNTTKVNLTNGTK